MDEKTYRAMRRHAGLCTKCGREDERTRAGYARCASCAEKARLREAKRMQNPEKRARHNASVRQRLERLKVQGLCPQCGQPASDGFVYCANCREKYQIRWRSRSKTGVPDP